MNKKAIITSALPYSNGEIHLGHVASTYLLPMSQLVFKQNGVEAYYVCASDDFGTPILIQSEKLGQTPQEYVEHWNKRDYEDFTALILNLIFFIRPVHLKTYLLYKMYSKNFKKMVIFMKKKIIQFLRENDQKFLPDRFVKELVLTVMLKINILNYVKNVVVCLRKLINPHCSICGQTPVKKSTNHYFFKLKNFSDPLLEYFVYCPIFKRMSKNMLKLD